jgi:hypothetical protein
MPRIKAEDIVTLRTLPDGVQVGVSKGSKSEFDFIVHFKWGDNRAQWRMPTHVHLIVDMYTKRMGNPWLTNRFVDHVIAELIDKAAPATTFPPVPPPLEPGILTAFAPLSSFGEYRIEYTITVQGLIATAEKTNYPNGVLQHQMWQAFRDGEEIYRVLGIALRR